MVYLSNKRYEELKKIGTDIIVDAEISKYPFDVFQVADKLDIEVVDYQSQSNKKKKSCFEVSEDGFSILYEKNGMNYWRIYYNSEMIQERIRFTVMHEVAHISANHMYGNEVEESEANFLASFVLAPPCIIHEKQIEDYIDLANGFGLSQQMGYFQMEKYNKWLKCGDYYQDYEQKILNLYRNKKSSSIVEYPSPTQVKYNTYSEKNKLFSIKRGAILYEK